MVATAAATIAKQAAEHRSAVFLCPRRVGLRKTGIDNHHIIEQGLQNEDVPREIINAPYNIARIPRYKHWQITEYYRGPQKETGGVSPREYLKGKTPAERYQFGLGVLRKFGVLQ